MAFPYPGPRAVKRIQSHGLRPWEGKWEEPAGITPASLGSQPGKSSRAPPYDPLGPKAPDPMSGFTAYQTGHNLGSYLFIFPGGLGAKPP